MRVIAIIGILFSACVSSMSYLTLAPFFPILLRQKHIDVFFNGPVFAMYSLPFFLSPYLVANWLLPKFGRLKTYLLGGLILGIGMIMFAVLK